MHKVQPRYLWGLSGDRTSNDTLVIENSDFRSIRSSCYNNVVVISIGFESIYGDRTVRSQYLQNLSR